MNYLAYGSNLYPPRLEARISILSTVGIVEMKNQRLTFGKRGGDGTGKCTLVDDSSSCAYGVIYEISATDKSTLDRIEGLGDGYEGAWIPYDSIGNCFYYRAPNNQIDNGLQPFDWYKAFVLAGMRHHGFPEGYIAEVQKITALRDPDSHRRLKNLELLDDSVLTDLN